MQALLALQFKQVLPFKLSFLTSGYFFGLREGARPSAVQGAVAFTEKEGFGLRFRLSREGTHVRADCALGREDAAIYLTVGEAF